MKPAAWVYSMCHQLHVLTRPVGGIRCISYQMHVLMRPVVASSAVSQRRSQLLATAQLLFCSVLAGS
jgi:hypothetical protein